jgi:hypothetical protein
MANSKCADVIKTLCYVFKNPEEQRGACIIVAENYQASRDKEKVIQTVAVICDKVKSTHGDFTMYKSHLPFIAGVNIGKNTPEFCMVLDCNDYTYTHFLDDEIVPNTIQTC